jgi:hypothetical protein
MLFSFFAGVISFVSYVAYFISTVRGKTKPSRSTWWVLTLVGLLVFSSSYTIGAKENFWIMLTYIIGPLSISLLSLHPKYRYGHGFLLIDKLCLACALVCAAVWLIFKSPQITFIGSILVEILGMVPTYKKAYLKPKEEDPIAWSIEMLASIINAFGITTWFSLKEKDWIYAGYLLLANGIILLILWVRAARLKR